MIWIILIVVLGIVVLFALIRAGIHLYRDDEPVVSSSWGNQTTHGRDDDAPSD
jgi:hypothetical protein